MAYWMIPPISRFTRNMEAFYAVLSQSTSSLSAAVRIKPIGHADPIVNEVEM
jgi:hypothetical protein